jgi:hypothetical protein
MKKVVVMFTMLLLVGFPTSSFAQKEYSFSPQAANVVGTNKANTRTPFTRVWTQLGGELAIARMQERYVNLAADNLKMAQLLRKIPPVVAYMNIAWGDQLLHLICTTDLSQSNPLSGRFLIVLRVAEGSLGSTPVGTIVGLSDFRMFKENGVDVMTADLRFTPGIFPDVLPTSLTITDQLVPDVWRTPSSPGTVIAEHTFTSIQPPDGSDPITYTVREEIPIN